MRARDVVVVGAGPAGSLAAGLLAERGWRVELLERAIFPRAKPCGEFVNPGALAILERTGYLDAVRALDPAPLRGWSIGTWEGARTTGFFGPRQATPQPEPHGFGVPRADLDHALAQQATARGAVLSERVQVIRLRATSGSRVRSRGSVRVAVRDSGRLGHRNARFVLVADGLRSGLARQLGAVSRRPRLNKLSLTCRVRGRGPDARVGHLRLGGDLTVGLASVHAEGGLWNATVVVDPTVERAGLRRSPTDVFRGKLDLADFSWEQGPTIAEGPWASGPFDWPVRSPTGPGYALIGDASGYYDPLTGQGIYRALRSAELAARAVDDFLRNGATRALSDYGRTLRREVTPSRRVQRMIEGVVSRGAPRRMVFSRVAGRPGAMSPLVRVTGDIAPAASLLHPSVLLSFLSGRTTDSLDRNL